MIGQSGSGKSLTLQSIMGLLPKNMTREGEILFEGVDLNPLELSKIRGREMFTIFQGAMNAFNPSVKLFDQLYWLAGKTAVSKAIFHKEIIEVLNRLGFTEPEKTVKQYPFQLSGGMLQRMMIACALYVKPKLLLADEPTTALDSSVQKEFLGELSAMKNQTTILLVTHDLGVVAEIADEVIVILDGEIVESGDVYKVFHAPRHEYTKRLLKDSIL